MKTTLIFTRHLSTLAKRKMSTVSTSASEFPPASVRAIALEVSALLKERKETVSVAETVRDPLALP